ncbi:calcitonin gene-related peptide type 1 receptor-like [Aphis craccivora]|uniref:Calcitonin gene-related peptide type 1 receptor-like n=1 Tax=Aphis craccivora TaxID=307492 RepID=A0A6G0ZLW8_APHCR|nr:calcitonin gene-related peptide type 1 receptor-like [Aphis craccivora]
MELMSDPAGARVHDSNTLFLIELRQKCFKNAKPVNVTQKFCPRYFDGYACWEETLPNVTAFAPCPNYVVGFDPYMESNYATQATEAKQNY